MGKAQTGDVRGGCGLKEERDGAGLRISGARQKPGSVELELPSALVINHHVHSVVLLQSGFIRLDSFYLLSFFCGVSLFRPLHLLLSV